MFYLRKDEIQTREQSIEQFLRKSLEIQELLQSKEAPLELQVISPNVLMVFLL